MFCCSCVFNCDKRPGELIAIHAGRPIMLSTKNACNIIIWYFYGNRSNFKHFSQKNCSNGTYNDLSIFYTVYIFQLAVSLLKYMNIRVLTNQLGNDVCRSMQTINEYNFNVIYIYIFLPLYTPYNLATATIQSHYR